MSSSACVGCWSLPEPALMIGTGRLLRESDHAMRSARPFSCVRITMRSKYELNVRIESSRLSPLNSEDTDASRTSPVRRPRIWQAERNERNVRLDGCVK